MLKYILPLLLILAGCSVDNPSQHLSTEPQTDAETGLVLMPSDEMWISFPEMIALYKEVESCMGMTAPAPTVYFKDFGEYFNGGVGSVWGFHTQGTIYINTELDNPEFEAYGFYRDSYTDTETLRHEYIHNILYHINGDGDSDHSSEMYHLCGLGVKVEN